MVGPPELGEANPPPFPSTGAQPGQTIQHLLDLISQAVVWAVPRLRLLHRGLQQDFLLKAFLSQWGLHVGQSPVLTPQTHTGG